ncbi:MAG: ATP-binding protein [Armatimonadota bacterium]
MAAYIKRTLQPKLLAAASEFPAVVLTGPRQSGKTTLLKHMFGGSHSYVSLEPPDVRASAAADPRGFLDVYPPPVIFDEVQYVPDLLPYIKERIDANRSRKGQYLLTGSQNLMMMSQITESLAGRSAILRLFPLSMHELTGRPYALFPWDEGYVSSSESIPLPDIWSQFIRGYYPELAAEPDRESSLWYSSYVQTYLERDIRGLKQIGDLASFQSFLRVIAARSGQLLNLSDVSSDLGIAVNTAKSWLSILEATYQVVVLRPYFVNAGKRLVKTPKVYFTDVGMLCHLVGLSDQNHAASGPMAGAIVETAVVAEVFKAMMGRGFDPQVYFWRTSHSKEVDLVIEQQGRLIPLEVKSTATPRPLMASGLKSFMEDYSDRTDRGWLVHLGSTALPLAPGILSVPITEL